MVESENKTSSTSARGESLYLSLRLRFIYLQLWVYYDVRTRSLLAPSANRFAGRIGIDPGIGKLRKCFIMYFHSGRENFHLGKKIEWSVTDVRIAILE